MARERLLDNSYLDSNLFTPIDLGNSVPSGLEGIGSFDFGIDTSFGGNTPEVTKPGFLSGQGGKNLTAGIQGLGALGSALAAYKQYKLGKDTLQQNKAAFNRNLENSTAVTNAQIQDRALSNAQGDPRYRGDFDRIQVAANTRYQDRKLDGSPI